MSYMTQVYFFPIWLAVYWITSEMGKFFNFRDIVICISGIFFRWGAWNKKFVEFFSIGGQIGNRWLGYLSCQNIRNHTKHDKNFFNIHLHVFNSKSIVLSLIRLFLCFYIPNVYKYYVLIINIIHFFLLQIKNS